MFGVATDVPDVSTKLHKASSEYCEVLLRTGLSGRDRKFYGEWAFSGVKRVNLDYW